MKPAIMELGGHGPVIVCDDVDPVATAAASVTAKSRNAGQVCCRTDTFFSSTSLVMKCLLPLSLNAPRNLKSATAWIRQRNWGHWQIRDGSRRWSASYQTRPRAARGLLAGGQRIGNRGYYYPLTVLADVPDDALAMNEEPFGPLALVNPVRDLDEAITKANAQPFGLAAYAFTHASDKRAAAVQRGRDRQSHDQSLRGIDSGNAVRRCEGQRLRTRRRHRGAILLHNDEERLAQVRLNGMEKRPTVRAKCRRAPSPAMWPVGAVP